MNIFKKLFKNPGIDIDKLINSHDLNDSIIEIDNYICKICEYGHKLDILTQPQKNFFYNQNLEREINNGGFNQFYFNSSGNFANETIDSLNAIGANKTAKIIQKANNQFPNQTVPKDKTERQEVLEKIEDNANETWEMLDEEFFVYEDDLNSLNIEYVKAYKNEF